MAESLGTEGLDEGGEGEFAALVSRAYSLLPAGGFIPPLRLGRKPESGDAAAWLDREVRLGLRPKDPAGDWRKVARKIATRDVNYGVGGVPDDAAFRGPMGVLHTFLSAERGSWPVEGIIRWKREELLTIRSQFMFHLRAFMDWLKASAISGDTSDEGGY